MVLLLAAAVADIRVGSSQPVSTAGQDYLFLADPIALEHEGVYYIYGTRQGNRGIQVFQSKDLNNWTGPAGAKDGFALVKEDSYGEKHFMDPYIIKERDRFYCYYVATDEPAIAVATGDSPTGPFKQVEERSLGISGKSIAPHIFRDEDGRSYMYYTRLEQGNKIFVTEMSADLLSVMEPRGQECIRATELWEITNKNPNPNWPIAEGAAVLKHKETYYLFYTANHYINPDYNVGYATSSSPTGPWTKYAGNPILQTSDDAVGLGSGEFIFNRAGDLLFFYHAHYDSTKVSPRKTVYSRVAFVPDPNGGPDIVRIDKEKVYPRVINNH